MLSQLTVRRVRSRSWDSEHNSMIQSWPWLFHGGDSPHLMFGQETMLWQAKDRISWARGQANSARYRHNHQQVFKDILESLSEGTSKSRLGKANSVPLVLTMTLWYFSGCSDAPRMNRRYLTELITFWKELTKACALLKASNNLSNHIHSAVDKKLSEFLLCSVQLRALWRETLHDRTPERDELSKCSRFMVAKVLDHVRRHTDAETNQLGFVYQSLIKAAVNLCE